MTVSRKRVAAGVLAIVLGGLTVLAQNPTEGSASPQPCAICPIPVADQPSPGTTSSPCPCEPFGLKPTKGSPTPEQPSKTSSRPSSSLKPSETVGDTANDVPEMPEVPGIPELPSVPTGTATLPPRDEMPTPRPASPTPTPERPMPPAIVTEGTFPPPIPAPNVLETTMPVEDDFDDLIEPMPVVVEPTPMPEPRPEIMQPQPMPRPTPMPVVEQVEQPSQPAPSRVVPAGAREPVEMDAVTVTVPLRMLMRMGDGKPRFEVKRNDTLLLKAYGEQMRMNSNEPMPEEGLPNVSAVGRVRFYGPGFSGTCDQLSVMSSGGEIHLQGNVRMECKQGTMTHELAADEIIFQLGGTDLKVSNRGLVVPVRYVPND